MGLKDSIKKIPLLGNAIVSVKRYIQYKTDRSFDGSLKYWEERYHQGGNSGAGSYGRLAVFKAEFLNEFLKNENIDRAIELGCGDGNQLTMIHYTSYIGLDVSASAIRLCASKFKDDPNKSFYLFDPNAIADKLHLFRSDLGLSLDVIYHIIEDEVFEAYMRFLFSTANRFVIVYASNFDSYQMKHVRHRAFTKWVEKNISGWTLVKEVKNPYPYSESDPDNTSDADFFIYKKA